MAKHKALYTAIIVIVMIIMFYVEPHMWKLL